MDSPSSLKRWEPEEPPSVTPWSVTVSTQYTRQWEPNAPKLMLDVFWV